MGCIKIPRKDCSGASFEKKKNNINKPNISKQNRQADYSTKFVIVQ